jgi:hypothetical protein
MSRLDGGGDGSSADGTDGRTPDGGGGDVTGDGATQCPVVSLVSPSTTTLTAADDKDGDSCRNGFQYDIRIATNAPTGTSATLFANNTKVGTGTVSGATVTFSSVTLNAQGATTLKVQLGTDDKCDVSFPLTIDCNVPTCNVTTPVISATHPKLNGVPSAMGGDRASAAGSAYQVAFSIATNIEDGQLVSLKVAPAATPGSFVVIAAAAHGGTASFSGVTLVPDGDYNIQATCTNHAGTVGTSTNGMYTVDTQSPDLTVTKPTDGQHFNPGDLDTSGAFQVCGTTTAADAENLPATLGAAAQNFLVGIGTQTSSVTPVAMPASGNVCVNVPCPGGAAFSLTVTLKDGAGNPQQKTITGITCASAAPSVQVVDPVGDSGSFGDMSKHLLAASAQQTVKDQDAATPGAQYTVVACTDRTSGTAQLVAGPKGSPPAAIGAPVTIQAAQTSDKCPAGYGGVARFANATLPESTESAAGALLAPTELRVDVTDVSTTTGSSLPDDLWVDSVAPVVSLSSPTGLCGSFQSSATSAYVTDVGIASDAPAVVVGVTNASATSTYSTPTYASGVATFAQVNFGLGQNDLVATATDAAGNSTTLAPAPCSVTVGAQPVVTFTAPTAGANLCGMTSELATCIKDNSATAGWQGTLSVHVTASGAAVSAGVTVTFTAGGMTYTATTDGSGNAQVTGATLPEGANVTVTATTADIAGHGVGTGTVTVNVDTVPPSAPTGLSPSVVDRRLSSFKLAWTAPDDNGANVTSYDIRLAKVAITTGNFDDTTVTSTISYGGQPAAKGQPDSVNATGLNIEQDYYFAIAAVDAAGNRGPIAATTTAATAHFLTTLLTGPGAADGSGYVADGSGDFGRPAGKSFTGDMLSDLVVGAISGSNVYLYFGTSNGYDNTAPPSVTINFPGSTASTVLQGIDAGDLDGDGLDDLAISSNTDSKVYIFSRKSAAWATASGGWPSSLTASQANYTITVGGTYAGQMSSRPLARLGNFDGIGGDDLGIGLAKLSGQTGAIVVVKGGALSGNIPTLDSSNSIEIDGPAASSNFGVGVLGIGRFYPSPAGTTLVSIATLMSSAYAFAGQAPAGGTIAASAANDVTVGTSGDVYGATFGLIGPLGGSPAALTLASFATGYVDVNLGTLTTGPFQGASGTAPAAIRLVNPNAPNSFGIVNIGGGIKGTSGVVSIIGNDQIPDLIVAGQGEPGSPIYIISGTVLPSMSGTVNVGLMPPGVVKASGYIPWIGYSPGNGAIIPDCNGDHYGDFVVGESAPGAPGRAIVFY